MCIRDRAKTYWKTQVLMMRETAEGQAFYQGYWTSLGWLGFPEEYVAGLAAVTGEEVQAAVELLAGADPNEAEADLRRLGRE